jgi:hypothetical protein
LVRTACLDPVGASWVSKIDKFQSDDPYYFNVETKEVSWVKPLAFNYFGNLPRSLQLAY